MKQKNNIFSDNGKFWKIGLIIFWSILGGAILFTFYLDAMPQRYSISNKGSLKKGVAVRGGFIVNFEFDYQGQTYSALMHIDPEPYDQVDINKRYIVRFSPIVPQYASILVEYNIGSESEISAPYEGWKAISIKKQREYSIEDIYR